MTEPYLSYLDYESFCGQCWATLQNGRASLEARELALSAIEDPCHGLFRLYSDDGSPLVHLESYSAEESSIPRLFVQNSNIIQSAPSPVPAIVPQNTFQQSFNHHSNNLLLGLNWNNVFIAGGSILRSLLKEEDESHSDIDIFLYGLDDAAANAKFQEILSSIRRNIELLGDTDRCRHLDIRKSRRTISITTAWTQFQVVTTHYQSPTEVLFSFDVDSCCVGTTDGGQNVYASSRGWHALSKRCNMWLGVLKPSVVIEGRYQKRLAKYARRGFSVMVPGFDWSSIPIHETSMKVHQLTGVSQLVALDRLTTEQPGIGMEAHFFVTDIDQAITGGSSWCRVCNKCKSQPSLPDNTDRFDLSQAAYWDRTELVYQDFDSNGLKTKYGPLKMDSNFESGAYLTEQDNIACVSFDESFPPMSSSPGMQFPNCMCGSATQLRTVAKVGPNQGRKFFSCSQRDPGMRCNFFQWLGCDLPLHEAREIRKRAKVDTSKVAADSETLNNPVSKYLYLIHSCFKSGRITKEERSSLKDKVMLSSSASMQSLLDHYERDQDLDALASALKSILITS